jgi:hypothetical protein
MFDSVNLCPIVLLPESICVPWGLNKSSSTFGVPVVTASSMESESPAMAVKV